MSAESYYNKYSDSGFFFRHNACGYGSTCKDNGSTGANSSLR